MDSPNSINPESAEVIAGNYLQHTSKLPRKALEKVLDDLTNLETTWLKPKTKGGK